MKVTSDKLGAMWAKETVVALMFAVPACGGRSTPPCSADARLQGPAEQQARTVDRAVSDSFFPKGVFAIHGGDDTPHSPSRFEEAFIGRLAAKLVDLGEGSLYARRADRHLHAYRVLYLPSLGVAGEWVMRTEERQGAATVQFTVAIACEDQRSSGLGVDRRTRVTAISGSTWSEIERCMDLHFWTATVREEAAQETTTSMTVHLDGATTVIEGVRDGLYHVVDRWGLDDTASVGIAACVKLIRQASAVVHDGANGGRTEAWVVTPPPKVRSARF